MCSFALFGQTVAKKCYFLLYAHEYSFCVLKRRLLLCHTSVSLWRVAEWCADTKYGVLESIHCVKICVQEINIVKSCNSQLAAQRQVAEAFQVSVGFTARKQ